MLELEVIVRNRVLSCLIHSPLRRRSLHMKLAAETCWLDITCFRIFYKVLVT
jgi:hypothetical protein